MIARAPNINHFWAALAIEELARNGTVAFCVSPGSRSTPLALAVAQNAAADCMVHFDERGAAFYGLGAAKAAGKPAVLVCTSGTAAANYLPAVVEASMSGVPLIVLTADRPPELRGSGANQTIDQVKLFGNYVRWFAEWPCPDPAVPPEAVLTLIDDVWRRAVSGCGPVHLNCPFREPLAPIDTGQNCDESLRALAPWCSSAGPYTRYTPADGAPGPEAVEALAAVTRNARQGLLIVGALHDSAGRDAALRIARRLGWPVAADPLSGLRNARAGELVAGHFDLVLLSDKARVSLAPDAVIHLGGPVTSKRLLQFLEVSRPRDYVHVSPAPMRHDPGHRVTVRIEASLPGLAARLESGAVLETPGAWRDRVRALSRCAEAAVERVLAGEEALSEVHVAGLVAQRLPEGHGLMLGNSMPIRDADTFAGCRGGGVHITGNRGASGIDGLVATAAGYAAGLRMPVTAVVGDLAVLHDLNSLALMRQAGFPVTLIVINNNGGGVFSFLPVAQFPEHFEKYFGTPHGLDFEHAARMFGLGYARPATPEAFAEAYTAAAGGPSGIIEVRTDRAENAALHARLHRAVLEAVDGEA